jgi:hypothetical protein
MKKKRNYLPNPKQKQEKGEKPKTKPREIDLLLYQKPKKKDIKVC